MQNSPNPSTSTDFENKKNHANPYMCTDLEKEKLIQLIQGQADNSRLVSLLHRVALGYINELAK